jgi:hypothetical protein
LVLAVTVRAVSAMSIPRPKQLLIDTLRACPDAAPAAERCRAHRGKSEPGWPGGRFPDWPPYVYLPSSFASAFVAPSEQEEQAVRSMGAIEVARRELVLQERALTLAAVLAWRPTQGIYRFDQTLLEALWETSLDGDLPCELLHRLPEWCVYVETAGKAHDGEPLQGFFAYLDREEHEQASTLCVIRDFEQGPVSLTIPLHGDRLAEVLGRQMWSVATKLRQLGLTREQIRRTGLLDPHRGDAVAEQTAPLLSLLLYLCSVNAEIQDGAGTPRVPEYPTPKRTKKGDRLFAPDRPTTWEVGYRLGAALRRAQQQERQEVSAGTHASPRPHIRRAHWHSFWSGPKSAPDTRRLQVRWMPPIAVALKDVDELVPVIRPVS